jgi:hypothetical protein
LLRKSDRAGLGGSSVKHDVGSISIGDMFEQQLLHNQQQLLTELQVLVTSLQNSAIASLARNR